jgi:acyl-CoA thioesterase
MGSLGHTVIFHAGAERLRTVDRSTKRRRWFVQEAWTSNSGENRGCHESRLWDWKKGEVVATTLQDGMVRINA